MPINVLLFEYTDPGAAAVSLPYLYQPAQEILGELIDEVLMMNANLMRRANVLEAVSVCFVIDGEQLQAKQSTHKYRKRRTYSSLKHTRKLVRLFLGKPAEERGYVDIAQASRAKFENAAAGWIRWFPEYKNAITEAFHAWGF